VIHYRSFGNFDPPVVVGLWNACLSGRRVVPLRAATVLEYFTLAKPYFDPNGLILALAGDLPVGFVHAGFGPNAGSSALDTSVGVICALGVIPSYRRQGIGGELLRRAEQFLRAGGARTLYAGPLAPRNPFTFGLYGGCNSPGFLDAEQPLRPFFEKHGYQLDHSAGIFQRVLARVQVPPDPRFNLIRQRCDIIAAPYHQAGWWREAVLGPVEAVEYRLQEKQGGKALAQCVLWDMEPFRPSWGDACVGMIDLVVDPAYRRQGLARYLLSQVLRHLRDQPFGLFEALARLDDPATLGLLQGLEFEQVDVGHCYRLTSPASPSS
jgi:ribosomal protein S18 acetylase RimI-like enzyme